MEDADDSEEAAESLREKTKRYRLRRNQPRGFAGGGSPEMVAAGQVADDVAQCLWPAVAQCVPPAAGPEQAGTNCYTAAGTCCVTLAAMRPMIGSITANALRPAPSPKRLRASVSASHSMRFRAVRRNHRDPASATRPPTRARQRELACPSPLEKRRGKSKVTTSFITGSEGRRAAHVALALSRFDGERSYPVEEEFPGNLQPLSPVRPVDILHSCR